MSDLQEQIEEFESIQNIYDPDKLTFDPLLIEQLKSHLKSNSPQSIINKLPKLKFTLACTDALLIDCTLPSLYPSSKEPILFIRLSSSKYSKASINDANNLLKSRITQIFDKNNPILFDLFDWIQENIPSVIKVANFNTNKNKKNKKKMPKQLNLQRTYMWFHHIYSSTKKRNINQLAKQYKLTGFCVTGKPGVIVAEGYDKDVNQYIFDLKSWNWQKMIVRHTENHLCDNNDIFNEMQKFDKWTFTNIAPHTKGGMKDVYDHLNNVGLEHYYKMIVHINTPIDANLNDQNDNNVDNKTNGNGNGNINDNQYDYMKYKNKNKKKTKYDNNNNDNLDNNCIAIVKEFKYLHKHKNGVLLNIHVKPNAKETSVVTDNNDDNCLYLRIAAAPTDGGANKEVCKFISNIIGCGKSNVSILRGHKSRDKCVLIKNMVIDDISTKLTNYR